MIYPAMQQGATNQTISVYAYDNTTFLPETGLVFNSAGITARYRLGAVGALGTITLATLANAQAAHADGGFVEVSSTLSPGEYRLDLPDAVVASGTRVEVQLVVTGATFLPITIPLTAYDPYAAGSSDAQIATAVELELSAQLDAQDATLTAIPASVLAATIDGVTVADYLSAAGGGNFSIAGTVLTVRDVAGNTIYTRTLTLTERNAINAAAV